MGGGERDGGVRRKGGQPEGGRKDESQAGSYLPSVTTDVFLS